MAAIPIIRQSDDLEFSFDLNGDDITGWICTMVVKESVEGPDLIERVIPPQGNAWPGFLTSTETAPFNLGIHLLIGTLDNAGTDQNRQINKRFLVTAEIL